MCDGSLVRSVLLPPQSTAFVLSFEVKLMKVCFIFVLLSCVCLWRGFCAMSNAD